jgi:hypothetical protein
MRTTNLSAARPVCICGPSRASKRFCTSSTGDQTRPRIRLSLRHGCVVLHPALMMRSRSVPRGFALARVVGELDDGVVFIDRALENMANQPPGEDLSWLTGRSDQASRTCDATEPTRSAHVRHAHRRGTRAFLCGSLSSAERALKVQPNWVPAWRNAATNHALAGRPKKARHAMAHAAARPEIRLSNLIMLDAASAARAPLRGPVETG